MSTANPVLPLDILLRIRHQLEVEEQSRTLLHLALSSRAFEQIYLPGLRAHHLKLNKDNAAVFLKALMPTSPPVSPHLRLQSRRAVGRPKDVVLGPNRYHPLIPRSLPYPSPRQRQIAYAQAALAAKDHRQAVAHLKSCKILELRDIESIEAIIEAYEHAGEEADLWGNVHSLSLGGNVLWTIAQGSDKHIALEERLLEILDPNNLCVRCSVGSWDAFRTKQVNARWHRGIMPTPAHDEDDLDEWTAKYLSDCTSILQELTQNWALKSITIHNLSAESLPHLGAQPIKVFFSPSPPPLSAHIEKKFICDCIRAVDIADMICLLGGPEERIEFVGAGCRACPVEGGEREGEEGGGEVARKDALEKRVWETTVQEWLRGILKAHVRFTTREEAEACRCCGGK